MNYIGLIDLITNWWENLNAARQVFYGIGLVAAFSAVVLAVLSFIGMEHHEGLDGVASDADHGGGGILSIKPLTGFFLGFGWAGGMSLDFGWSFPVAIVAALFAGAVMMALIVFMFRTILALRSDGTVRIQEAIGAIGTVYVTLPPAKASGGQVTVSFSGRQETLAALNLSTRSVSSGEKIKVVQIIDSRTVLVEPLA